MKLGTVRNGKRDGQLVVVSGDLKRLLRIPQPATLQAALDDWKSAEPYLRDVAAKFEADPVMGEPLDDWSRFLPPLPRAYEWVDGSAFLNHVRLVRKARNAEMPDSFLTDPLVYQGGSSVLLAPRDPIPLPDPSWGLDFESEVVCVLADTPQGTKAAEASPFVALVTLCNDVTLRNLIPNELAKQFGFFQSKPATAFAPLAITPDELGSAWQEGRLHLPLKSHLDGLLVGDPNAGPEMQFSFFELIQHIAKTRSFGAGTLLGSGTISNADRARGWSCIAEVRALETIDTGSPKTPFLKAGQRIRIEMHDAAGRSLFGAIEQEVAGA